MHSRRTTLRPYLVSPRPQAEEILEHLRVMVAFVDVQGTVDYFRHSALAVGIVPQNIHGPIELTVQFRYAGSDAFVSALDSALYDDSAVGFSHEQFLIRVRDSVEDTELDMIHALKNGYSARLVAGFCWMWSDPTKDGFLSQISKSDAGLGPGIVRP